MASTPVKGTIKMTLLFVSALTVMSSITLAPALSEIEKAFNHIPNAKFLTKMILTIPGLSIAITSPITGRILEKVSKRSLLIFSLILYAVAGSSGFLINNLYLILFFRAVLGIAVAFIMTTSALLIADYFKGVERSKFAG